MLVIETYATVPIVMGPIVILMKPKDPVFLATRPATLLHLPLRRNSLLPWVMRAIVMLKRWSSPSVTRSTSSGTHYTRGARPKRNRSRLSMPKVAYRYVLRFLLTIGTV